MSEQLLPQDAIAKSEARSYPAIENKALNKFLKFIVFLLLIVIIFTPFTVIDAGERGVLMKFGQVQERILKEGIHPIILIVHRVKKLK